jgi:hypothetical protein
MAWSASVALWAATLAGLVALLMSGPPDFPGDVWLALLALAVVAALLPRPLAAMFGCIPAAAFAVYALRWSPPACPEGAFCEGLLFPPLDHHWSSTLLAVAALAFLPAAVGALVGEILRVRRRGRARASSTRAE